MTPHPTDHPHDDRGSVVTRRQALALFASPLLMGLAGCGRDQAEGAPLTGSCVVRPELTEGPFFLDTDLMRSDIREDRLGVPLALAFSVAKVVDGACEMLPGALVDVWHADAGGDYSGVGALRDARFLRGVQETGADGSALFTTVYPGWYPGRAPHIHFKVRSPGRPGSAYEFTSQLFFDDALSRQVYTTADPYRQRGAHDRPTDRDGIYRRGGPDLRLAVSEAGGVYRAAFDLALYVG